MLAEFFDITKDSRTLFEGLAVSTNKEVCAQWMNQYPVIFLSLKDIGATSFAQFLENFAGLIGDTCDLHNYLLQSPAVTERNRQQLKELVNNKPSLSLLTRSLVVLSRALKSYHKKPTVILIDEYDAPVAKAADNGFHDEIVDFLRDFLSAGLKTNFENLKFGILTGCMRITQQSIFSGLNNLNCFGISNTLYADTFGFTEAEVDTLLTDAALSSVKDDIKAWYDGYCFGKNQEIYCPWSIMSYIYNLQREQIDSPQPYWLHVSSNAQIRRFIRNKTPIVENELAQLLSGCAIAKEINVSLNYDEIEIDTDNLWTLLYMSGFLTRRTNPTFRAHTRKKRDGSCHSQQGNLRNLRDGGEKLVQGHCRRKRRGKKAHTGTLGG